DVDGGRGVEEDVTDSPADRGAQREDESDRAEVAADRQRDQAEAGKGQRDAGYLSGPRALVQGERDEEDREERLGLNDDRGQTRRHAVGEGEELQQELAGEQRQAERHERAPGERPSEPDRRRGRDQKSDRRQLWR